MSMKKLYKLNMHEINTLNIAHLNPTLKAIVKTMYKLQKEDINTNGLTGDIILKYAVEFNMWKTKQEEHRYNTTWAYYIKVLKKDCRVEEVGFIKDSYEEYLED
jgi:hypothetical protein